MISADKKRVVVTIDNYSKEIFDFYCNLYDLTYTQFLCYFADYLYHIEKHRSNLSFDEYIDIRLKPHKFN